MNCLYAESALNNGKKKSSIEDLAKRLSKDSNENLREEVRKHALKNGMIEIQGSNGVNIGVQIFDSKQLDLLHGKKSKKKKNNFKSDFVLIVMDYAFGEQAYELMDELLKPHIKEDQKIPLNIQSVNIMGKAGILEGKKGDIMIPSAFIFEGSADNYPIDNDIRTKDFDNSGLTVYEGPMITVLGTSLQNRDILRYFLRSSWQVIGLEMEGAHYQKAIQAASKIRNSVQDSLSVRFAYYASDNPLETGSTLSSGGLGVDGVKPTYLITKSFLSSIMKG